VQVLPEIDADGDGVASGPELQAWADRRADTIVGDLVLRIDDAPARLGTTAASASLAPGQAGLQVLRLDVHAVADLPRRGTIELEDRGDDGRIGWHEVTAAGVDGVAIEGSDVPVTSPSGGLRAYPMDAAESPLDVRRMRADFAPGVSAGTASDAIAPAPLGAVPGAALLTGALARGGVGMFVAAIVIAIGVGAWHALLPGHGKTLMAAAMVGGGARARQAAAAAVAVAGMHTVAVLVLGVAVLVLEASFRPETLYPWLGFVSGAVAVLIGVSLLRRRVGAWRHVRRHEGPHDHPHAHPLPLRADGRLGLRGLGALALAGGIVPAPSALLALLAAIQLHRTAAGVAVVTGFSVGLAAALLGVGLGAMKARDVVNRRASAPAGMALAVISALLMVIVGGAIAAGALTRL
jgi:ABC-type nickel/cobalt efflux system permease component RcnA